MNAAPITPELRGQVFSLREQGFSYRTIGAKLRVSHTTVANVLREAAERGEVPVLPVTPPAVAPSPNVATTAPQPAPHDANEAGDSRGVELDEIGSLQAKLVQLNESADRAFRVRDFAAHSTIVRSISMVTKDIAKLRGGSEVDPEQDKATQQAGKRAAERLRKLLAEALASR